MISYEIRASVAKIYNRHPLSPHAPIGPIWAALIPVPIILLTAKDPGSMVFLYCCISKPQ